MPQLARSFASPLAAETYAGYAEKAGRDDYDYDDYHDYDYDDYDEEWLQPFYEDYDYDYDDDGLVPWPNATEARAESDAPTRTASSPPPGLQWYYRGGNAAPLRWWYLDVPTSTPTPSPPPPRPVPPPPDLLSDPPENSGAPVADPRPAAVDYGGLSHSYETYPTPTPPPPPPLEPQRDHQYDAYSYDSYVSKHWYDDAPARSEAVPPLTQDQQLRLLNPSSVAFDAWYDYDHAADLPNVDLAERAVGALHARRGEADAADAADAAAAAAAARQLTTLLAKAISRMNVAVTSLDKTNSLLVQEQRAHAIAAAQNDKVLPTTLSLLLAVPPSRSASASRLRFRSSFGLRATGEPTAATDAAR